MTALRLGKTKISGRCVGISPVNGQQIIFSEDEVQINVVPFDKVKIKTPLTRIRLGAVMPATIWGVPNISPMILGEFYDNFCFHNKLKLYGGKKNASFHFHYIHFMYCFYVGTLHNLRVRWHTNQPDIVDILGVFSEAGIEYEETDSISVRVKALNPGRAKIQAEVHTPNGKQICSVDITVFKSLELELPKRVTTDAIIVPPRSFINLKANLPDVSYQFADATVGGLKISSDGILSTGDAVGRDLIIVSIAFFVRLVISKKS